MNGSIPLLSVKNLSCERTKDQLVFSDISFDVHAGDILVLTGRSGCGKTTLLKCLSHLNVYQGEILFNGRKPQHYGIPVYRTHVLYVPQRPSLLPATPRDFVNLVSTYSSRKPGKRKVKTEQSNLTLSSIYSLTQTKKARSGALQEPMNIAEQWDIDDELWDRPWVSLSGGETQRIALAVAVGMAGAEILLLDEPTSALDAETTALVETTLQNLIKNEESTVKAIVWITHSEEQGRRVGTRFLYLEGGVGGCLESMEMALPPSRGSRSSTAVSPALLLD